jgi:flagellar biosynthesis protein FlhG
VAEFTLLRIVVLSSGPNSSLKSNIPKLASLMIDQATTLRLMAAVSSDQGPQSAASAAPPRQLQTRTRTIAVTSGKGGVGKSNVAVNVALELAAQGQRVSLLDADLALANADVLFGLNPQYHLGHVVSGQRSLAEVIIEVSRGVRLIPGGSGLTELADLARDQHARLIDELCLVESQSDFMLIDTAAGIAANVTGVLRAASEIIIVTTPDPTAVVDAYATVKVTSQQAPDTPVWIVVNDVIGVGDAERVFAQLHTTAARFLGLKLAHLGTIPHDAGLIEAVREQTPVVEYAPEHPSSRALRLIARYLSQSQHPRIQTASARQSFWQTYREI